jgi:integrase
MARKKQAMKFHELADLLLRLKRLNSPRTRINAAFEIKRLRKNFGHLRLDEIDEETWTDYVAREQFRRPRKFFDDRKYMRMALRLAKKRKYVTEVVDLPIPDASGTVARAPSLDEIAALERYASPTLRFQIQIAWRMGLRRGEVLRLRWDQIDLRDALIRLAAADTKTRRARAVPIPKILMAEFSCRRQRAACQWVFWNPTLTGPVTTNARAWRRAKALAGVSCRFQDLRHACATTIVRRGGQPAHGARYLGHSPSMFVNRYVHPNEKDVRQIARLMSR